MVLVQRDAIVQTARSWMNTPYTHYQCCKGVGVDCAHLIIGVGKDVGIFPQEFTVPYYSPQWLLHKKAALLLTTLEANGFVEKSVAAYLPGDVLVFENVDLETSCHVAIALGNGRAIHAHWSRGVAKVREFRLMEPWTYLHLKRCYVFPGVAS